MFSGDELLEWNGYSLVGKTYDEVHDIIADSRHEPQVRNPEHSTKTNNHNI
jgi:hypothetical protein